VVIIEHNLDVIKTADWIIDMGPEGGQGGGTVVASGPPEKIMACTASYTGHYLKRLLKASNSASLRAKSASRKKSSQVATKKTATRKKPRKHEKGR